MSYQAVIRDDGGNLIAEQEIGMQISILHGSASGTAVYVETQTQTTNINGLVNVEIGTGTVVSGDFSTIDWGDGLYFIKTETAVEAPFTTYTIIGTSQLLSVPYALHAKTVERVDYLHVANTPIIPTDVSNLTDNTNLLFNGNYTSLTNLPTLFDGDYNSLANLPQNATTTTDGFLSAADKTKLDGLQNVDGSETKLTAGTNVTITGSGTSASPYVVNASSAGERYHGEEYLDGIIFYLYIGSDGQQHGLVVSKTETTAKWQNTGVLVNADRTEDGAFNTGAITDSPAKDWVTSLGAGWYLPSIDELGMLWQYRFHVNKTARAIGSTLLSTKDLYWSSTEDNTSDAFTFGFRSGSAVFSTKTFTERVRAVRAF